MVHSRKYTIMRKPIQKPEESWEFYKLQSYVMETLDEVEKLESRSFSPGRRAAILFYYVGKAVQLLHTMKGQGTIPISVKTDCDSALRFYEKTSEAELNAYPRTLAQIREIYNLYTWIRDREPDPLDKLDEALDKLEDALADSLDEENGQTRRDRMLQRLAAISNRNPPKPRKKAAKPGEL